MPYGPQKTILLKHTVNLKTRTIIRGSHMTQPLNFDRTKTLTHNLYKSNAIDTTTYRFLNTDNQARAPKLNLIPKIQIPNIPGRPIISGCGGPTVKVSQYADYLLTPLLQHIPSYVQDTTDFLCCIFVLNNDLPNTFILITNDVKSLYT